MGEKDTDPEKNLLKLTEEPESQNFKIDRDQSKVKDGKKLIFVLKLYKSHEIMKR